MTKRGEANRIFLPTFSPLHSKKSSSIRELVFPKYYFYNLETKRVEEIEILCNWNDSKAVLYKERDVY